MSARPQPASSATKFPGSKLTAVAFAAVLLGGATAWIGARDQRATAARNVAPQPASAPAGAPGQRGAGGYAPSSNAPAPSRPQPTTRTRAS